MGVRYLKADYSYPHFAAGNGAAQRTGHFLGEKLEAGIFIIFNVKYIVGLFFGNYEYMTRLHGIDVEKSEIAVGFGYFV